MKKLTLFLMAGAVLASCSNGQKQGLSAEEYLGYNPDEQQLQIGDEIAIANTQYGQVKGFVMHGVYTWLGIPYGAPTSLTIKCGVNDVKTEGESKVLTAFATQLLLFPRIVPTCNWQVGIPIPSSNL